MRSLFEQIPAALVVADRQGRLMWANALAHRAGEHGVSPELWLAPDSVFLPDGETPFPVDEQPLSRALRGESCRDVEQVVRHQDLPKGIVLSVSSAPWLADDGSIEGAVLMLVDVTARRRTEEQLAKTEQELRHAQKMEAVGRLASGVAHDFNNVVAAIMGYAHLLEEDLEANDPRREDVAEILRAAHRAAVLTRQLLSLSHQPVTEVRVVDLHDVVTSLEKMLRRVIGEDVDLRVDLRARAAYVLSDPSQLEQILMNLAVNARDAMPQGGKLTIETSESTFDDQQQHVMLAVTDTGVGMDEATQARIFEPFFTTKEPGRGTGLGLSTVYGIVQQNRGRIDCYSQPGTGTSFRVHLPAASGEPEKAEVEAETDARERPEHRPEPGTTVLVVEDNEEVLRVASRILRESGYRVLEANGFSQAHGHCLETEGRIHLLLSDIVLRETRGTELARQLRSIRPGMRVLYMSGYPAGALAHHGALAPGTTLVEKPFAPRTLLRAVAQALTDVEASSPIVAPGEVVPHALVVDDDPVVRKVLVRLTQHAGFQVSEASDGQQAAERLAESRFDVIISDVAMPGMSGIDLLRAARRYDLDVPVILVTGAPDVDSATRAVQYGAFRYLGKPLDAAHLTEVLARALRVHRLARIKRDALASVGREHTAADLAGLEVRFERALERSWLAFQPIVDVRHHTIYGFEGLFRSDEPSMPSPMAMLAAAEQLGRLEAFGRRVRELMAEAASEAPPDSLLCINVHADELADDDIASPDSALAPISQRVVFEIAERSATADPAQVQRRVSELRDMGYRIALDDVGVGQGIAAFAQLEPELAKIDGSLVRDINLSEERRRVVQSLVSLCQEMGVTVIAEGVETPAERDCLAELGCHLLQGYLFARPSPNFRVPGW